MSLSLTIIGFAHVTLSLLALACGLILVLCLVAGRQVEALASLYLAIAVVAVATGFVIGKGFGVPQMLGVAAAIELMIAIAARHAFHLAGIWRPIFAVAIVANVHVFVFFAIGEAFLRLSALKGLAPTLTELPFAVVQLAGIVVFVALAIAAVAKFRNAPVVAD